jgi:hypothetical protein
LYGANLYASAGRYQLKYNYRIEKLLQFAQNANQAIVEYAKNEN